ncbi:hypothetical protein Fcan01_10173 [Folsomia candida]|uniref:Uncharacterized protein n=1 Tax=Folsomia candida TaxID=158441 RepID=A0A226EAD4_FOLCA|nr:hypothetical protein Fcan01_10173 [Folsomia candida]
MDTPFGVVRLVQLLYINHYPFPYQLPYKFSYRKGIHTVEVVPLIRWYEKFIPLLLSLLAILLSTMSIYYLAGNEENLLQDFRFWLWVGVIIVSVMSTFGYWISLLALGQMSVQVWGRTVEFEWHVQKGSSFQKFT